MWARARSIWASVSRSLCQDGQLVVALEAGRPDVGLVVTGPVAGVAHEPASSCSGLTHDRAEPVAVLLELVHDLVELGPGPGVLALDDHEGGGGGLAPSSPAAFLAGADGLRRGWQPSCRGAAFVAGAFFAGPPCWRPSWRARAFVAAAFFAGAFAVAFFAARLLRRSPSSPPLGGAFFGGAAFLRRSGLLGCRAFLAGAFLAGAFLAVGLLGRAALRLGGRRGRARPGGRRRPRARRPTPDHLACAAAAAEPVRVLPCAAQPWPLAPRTRRDMAVPHAGAGR